MKKMIVTLQCCSLGLWLSSFLNAAEQTRSLLMMQCTAVHDETEQLFYGEGLKFVGSHMAIKECTDWADREGKDADKCRILTCEPVFDSPQDQHKPGCPSLEI